MSFTKGKTLANDLRLQVVFFVGSCIFCRYLREKPMVAINLLCSVAEIEILLELLEQRRAVQLFAN